MNGIGAQLAHDKVDRYRSIGVFGAPVYHSYVQMRAMFLAQRKDKLANYFARPTCDPDLGELRWTSEVPGAARRLRELRPEELVRCKNEVAGIKGELQALVADLRRRGGSGSGGGASFASLIEQAMRVPSQGEFLYFVGEQPVIAFWGFEDQTGTSVDPAAVVSSSAWPPAPEDHVPRTSALLADSDAGLHAAEPLQRIPRWWWFFAPLLLLAIAFALLRWWDSASPVTIGSDGAPQTAGREAGAQLEIPPGALERGDLSFLEGLWQLGDERMAVYEGRPDNVVGSNRLVLRFGSDGTGTNYAVERIRRGQPQSACSGGLRAHTDGKTLYFERLVCTVPGKPEAGASGSSRHECVLAGGKTTCYGVNDDGVRWKAPLRRLQ